MGNNIVQPTSGLNYRFNGKEKDDYSGLYYYGARYYDAELSRWLKQDPAGFSPNEMMLADPQHLNFYAFSRNNPISYMDPDGNLAFLAPFAPYIPAAIAMTTAVARRYGPQLSRMAVQGGQTIVRGASSFGRRIVSQGKLWTSGKELPLTGVDRFDALVVGTKQYEIWKNNVVNRGYTIVEKSLQTGDAANIDWVKKVLELDPKQFRYIDLLHESRHFGQLYRGAKQGVTSFGGNVKNLFEKGAYEYEQRLGEKFQFQSSYMDWLRVRIESYWTISAKKNYSKSPTMQKLWR